MARLRTILLIGLVFCAGIPARSPAADIVQTLLETTFDEKAENDDPQNTWRTEQGARTVIREQQLYVEAFQGLPQLSKRTNFTGGEFRLVLELRTGTESEATFYWASRGSPRLEENKIQVLLIDDDDWHSYEFGFEVPDILTAMRLRFSALDGTWEIRSMKLIRKCHPPLSIREVVPTLHENREGLRFTVANDTLIPVPFHFGNQEWTLDRGETVNLWMPIRPQGNLAAVVLTLHPNGFPGIVHPVFLYRSEGNTDWIKKPFGQENALEIAPDARMARLWRNNELIGIIAPLVHRTGYIPNFVLADDSTETELHFESNDVDLRIGIAPPHLNFEITDQSEQEDVEPLEGPAVRLFGTLKSGLLPGVEFLKEDDTSSSEIGIARPFNNRSKPNPLWITMPLAVLETNKGAAELHWEETTLQPTFSSPNKFDHVDDHRFSLIGTKIRATLDVLPPTPPNEESASFRALRSYIAKKGFPTPPPTLRTPEEQRQLYLQALAGDLQSKTEVQWGYALESEWTRRPFADMFSTLVRLTEAEGGRSRNPGLIVPGGSDITNDAIYFLFGRIPEWQQQRETAIQQILTTALANGSFLFRTRFPELETAASSYGYTALQALTLMEYVRITGDNRLFATVTKALEYLKPCDIPCGGFYWDTPFHTPDLQAAATLVWLYVWAYEYSGNAEYLERAKHFAFAGLPFVYQTEHEDSKHMLYGAVGKLGGTDRRPPLHCGLLSTRIGIQYAYALNLLAKHDKQTDWKKAALGILHATENLQYTEEKEAGCVPELFDVVTQKPLGWKVNPCALISLRWAIEEKVDSLFVLAEGKDRYTSPYPLRKTDSGIEAYNVPQGQVFHILYNANRYGTGEGNGVVNVE
jgi:hypothetical protein